jgi:3-hydroxybenzoate 6-monooxygenase
VNPDVIVVGGGIGGLSAAFALTRAGLTVRVLERASEFGEVGAGIQIAPNCTRILDEYGLLDEAKKLGVLPRNMVMKDALDGSELTRLDLGDLARRYGSPYMVIHRSTSPKARSWPSRTATCWRSTPRFPVGTNQPGFPAGTNQPAA